MTRLNVPIEKSLKEKLKIHCKKNGLIMYSVISKLIENFLGHHKT
jgi:hypothetical protein